MAIEQHGRLYDVVPAASGVLISLKGKSGVTFIGTAGTAAWSVAAVSAPTYNGSTTTLDVVQRYYTNTSQNGSAAWTVTDTTAAGTFVQGPPCAAGSSVSWFVDAASLPAGAEYIKVTATPGSSGTATLTAIAGDLVSAFAGPDRMPLLSGASS